MSQAIENLNVALQQSMTGRPKVGGFEHLAETLRRAGVTRNHWALPSCQSLYVTKLGPVVMQGTSLIAGVADVHPFELDALITALRADQAGQITFPEFLMATWHAGVISYDVDFEARHCTYHGAAGESYFETYPAVEL